MSLWLIITLDYLGGFVIAYRMQKAKDLNIPGWEHLP